MHSDVGNTESFSFAEAPAEAGNPTKGHGRVARTRKGETKARSSQAMRCVDATRMKPVSLSRKAKWMD
jgi:hypothetical protein